MATSDVPKLQKMYRAARTWIPTALSEASMAEDCLEPVVAAECWDCSILTADMVVACEGLTLQYNTQGDTPQTSALQST